MHNPTIIIIVGPTAVGKTAAAVRLALALQTRIISADSRQCFKQLNIGVAKPSREELQAVPHYFINSHSIRSDVNAAMFGELALNWTEEIFQNQREMQREAVAVMVGGTGLYIKAFCEGLDEIPSIDPEIRGNIEKHYVLEGMEWLQREVRLHDPAFFEQGEFRNPQRMMRALEVVLSTGRSILSFHSRVRRPRPFTIRKIGLELPREELYQRINHRVDIMMEQGLLEEVRALLPFRDLNALQTVGYNEIFDFLDGKWSLDEAVEAIKMHTRHYAKRQMTWFRKDPDIEWINATAFLETGIQKITQA